MFDPSVAQVDPQDSVSAEAQTFVLDPVILDTIDQGPVRIGDFVAGDDGDVLELASVVASHFGDRLGEVRVSQQGDDVLLQIRNSGEATYTDLVVLEGVALDQLRESNFDLDRRIYGSPHLKMGSILPDPGPILEAEALSESLVLPNDPSFLYEITAGQEVLVLDYDLNLSALVIQYGGSGADFTNNGSIWLELDTHGYLLNEGSHDIVNNGFVYIRGNHPVELTSGVRSLNSLVNNGEIFFVAESGAVTAVNGQDGVVSVENYGLIAVQSLGRASAGGNGTFGTTAGRAIGLDISNSVDFRNYEGAQLLVEAEGLAIGVFTLADNDLGAPLVDNAGLIEVRSAGPDSFSIGVDIAHAGYHVQTVVNSGTIRADWAIYARPRASVTQTQEIIRNLEGGLLDGGVFLDVGDDVIVNDGTITGNVFLDGGDDAYSGAGIVEGIVDLGFGADTYTGNGSGERVVGGRGGDEILGNGGNDIIVGGFGSDILDGGAGNDTLIGEWGDDTITVRDGDYVEAGTGDDRVILEDYSFEAVIGGTGTDTLVMASGARDFALAEVIADSRVQGFEAIELQADQRLLLDAASVDALTDRRESLRVLGSDANAVLLDGDWTSRGTVEVGEASFERWTSGQAEVLIQTDIATSEAQGESFGGLDDVASGAAAVRLGEEAGIDYSSQEIFVRNYVVDVDVPFEVEAEEIFFATDSATFEAQNDATLINNGRIENYSLESPSAFAITFPGRGTLLNNGVIEAQQLFETSTYYITAAVNRGSGSNDGFNPIRNFGEILSYSLSGTAIGLNLVSEIANAGLIAAISENGRALGVNGAYAMNVVDYSQTFFNSGRIYAEAGGYGRQVFFQGDNHVPDTYIATGVHAWGSLTNDGEIIATKSEGVDPDLATLGVYINAFFNDEFQPATLTNNGLISGTYAVTFEDQQRDGTPNQVINNGLLIGDVLFNGSDDFYDGTSGEIDGTVLGMGGNDRFIGGAFNDAFDGGTGTDTAIFFGNLADYDLREGASGTFTITGQGTDSVTNVEILRFDDVDVRLDLGSGLSIDPSSDDPNTFMANIRDFDGNDLGAAAHWVRIGEADANLDGSMDFIFINSVNGRFAEAGVDENGLVQFDNYGAGGDTRVVGIYIDPLVQSGDVEQGGPFDSQQRFQNDLFIGNIKEVLGSQDYDGDGFAEVYFALTDGTAYLRALMHADGNIQYANYQSEEQVIEYLSSLGYGEETYGDWFGGAGSSSTDGSGQAASAMDASQLLYARHEMVQPEFFG